jgi:uncharacterized membrane protein YqaE (UPF0057 family)
MARQRSFDGDRHGAGIGAIIAAILLPPLGIFLDRGITPAFWVGVILTVIGWIPGAIFALLVLLKPDILPIR